MGPLVIAEVMDGKFRKERLEEKVTEGRAHLLHSANLAEILKTQKTARGKEGREG